MLFVLLREHLSGNITVSDYTGNSESCKSIEITVSYFKFLKPVVPSSKLVITEAILIERYNQSLDKQFLKPVMTYTINIFYSVSFFFCVFDVF